jgi:antitoxin (DNA-binding transcriptional repressor) of toxin-antitoxin stability system
MEGVRMKSISLLEFRKNAEKIIRWSKLGKRMVMTYRGQPVIRLEPVVEERIDEDDPFLLLDGIIEGKRSSMSNAEMDRVIYGK